jgi:outer membrane immunogenic protein
MMKKTIIAMAIATATGGSAAAADLPRRPAQDYLPPSDSYSWTGPYAGLNLGYQWAKVTNNVTEPSGIAGGGQLGYNWQLSPFVFGVETDIQASAADDTFAPYKFSNPWFGTLRARIGYAINNVMLYGTGGLAYGELKGEFFGLEEDKTLVGWTAGAGIEYGFTQTKWTAKLEYLYMDLASRTYSITGVDNGLHSSFLRLGVNYRF